MASGMAMPFSGASEVAMVSVRSSGPGASPAATRLAEALAQGARPHLPTQTSDAAATAHALGRSVLSLVDRAARLEVAAADALSYVCVAQRFGSLAGAATFAAIVDAEVAKTVDEDEAARRAWRPLAAWRACHARQTQMPADEAAARALGLWDALSGSVPRAARVLFLSFASMA